MTDAQRELKPCPFCGSDVKMQSGTVKAERYYQVECDCGAIAGSAYTTEKAAADNWNRRSSEAQQQARLDELERFARDVATNYDCDSDAHKYGTTCRACKAQIILAAGGEVR